MKKINQIIGLCLVSAAVLTACAQAAPSATKVETPKVSFKAGTYTAEGKGNNGPVKVEAVFSDSKIESISVKEHTETAGLTDGAIKSVPSKIVELQSLDIDVVTGATYTSRAIKYAVADCVKQAGGEENALLKVDLDRPSESEKYFKSAVDAIEKPKAVNGVIEIKSYDELKKALGYYDYIVNTSTKEGKFMFVDGSASDGDTIKMMNDISAEGDKDNPKSKDGSDKMDVVTGATLVVTNNVTIDGNGKTIKGQGYPTFMFAGKLEDFENGAIEATLKKVTIDDAAYNAKIGGAVFVVGAATLNMEDSTISNSKAGSAKLAFNGGGAVYLNSHGFKPEEGKAILNAKNCTFTGNETANGGGAALMSLNGHINVYNSRFSGNKALSEMGVGGAIALRGESSLLVEGSEIVSNEAAVAGGGIYIFDGESLFKGTGIITSDNKAVIKNSTIKDNKAAHGADVAYGRFYSDTFKGNKEKNGLDISEGNKIGDYKDLTFTTIERTVLK